MFVTSLLFFSSSFSETSQPAVYNSAAHPIKGIKLGDSVETSRKMTEEIPLNGIMWKPNLYITKNQTWHYVNMIFLHLLPGLLIDGLLKLSGNKPLYVNIHCIIYVNIYIFLLMLYLPAASIT
jgi:fatty acyl-CoA reductase